jgi:hypothetical protein
MHGNSIEIPCRFCGKPFTLPPSRYRQGVRCCSRACSDAVRRTGKEVTCPQCGKVFWQRPSRARQGVRCCSHVCDGLLRRRDLAERFWEKVQKGEGCWPWTAEVNKAGYGEFHYDGAPIVASRMAWILTHGEIPAGLCVLHRCDNPPCVNPDHLFLGTRLDNATDCVIKGRRPRGEQHCCAKLTEAQVKEARARYDAGESCADLAAHFGLTVTGMRDVVRRKNWRHVC